MHNAFIEITLPLLLGLFVAMCWLKRELASLKKTIGDEFSETMGTGLALHWQWLEYLDQPPAVRAAWRASLAKPPQDKAA